jgi:DNA (cytosine-5)-methyltransferase 1
MLTYLEIAQRLRPRWVVWENVPGVLSSNGGRDFGSFLGALGELGYGWAYRVLDAQWCRTHGHPRAVPQRRRRVFVVGRLIERGAGDGIAAASVLFERESVFRDSPSRRTSREEVAADAGDCAASVCSKWSKGTGGPAGDECQNLTLQPVAYRWQNDRDGLVSDGTVSALRASAGGSGFHEMNHPIVSQPVPFHKSKRAQSNTDDETWVEAEQANTINAFDTGERDTHAVAHSFYSTGGTHGLQAQAEVAPAVKVGSGLGIPSPPAVAQAMTVRRLTPRECERLQGFPDDWTQVPHRGKPAADGPRYKALGNSMAVNCMEWIGERIANYER